MREKEEEIHFFKKGNEFKKETVEEIDGNLYILREKIEIGV